ncbi:DUF7342 family protein [Halostella salina]|uniref:DUF7342 family protein n=1 Tax=Halostella salina TaxID=1547897 RepID=UPI000EF7FE1F|nr:hypothetical protein [Halostella salina]
MSEEPRGPVPADGGDARSRWRADRTTFQRVYDVVTGTTEPATADEIGDRADCSADGARSALEQLVEMGVAEKRDGRPATYRRNDAYFRWKRVERLAEEHTAAELRERVDALVEEDEALQKRFGVPDPDAVSPGAFDGGDRSAVHDRWEALTQWRSVRRDLRVLQRAAHRAAGRDERGTRDGASV